MSCCETCGAQAPRPFGNAVSYAASAFLAKTSNSYVLGPFWFKGILIVRNFSYIFCLLRRYVILGCLLGIALHFLFRCFWYPENQRVPSLKKESKGPYNLYENRLKNVWIRDPRSRLYLSIDQIHAYIPYRMHTDHWKNMKSKANIQCIFKEQNHINQAILTVNSDC
jgi:hypothetical protein